MTTLQKTDGTVTSSILETMNKMLDHLIKDDGEDENQHHKNIRKTIEEPICISDDAECTQREIKQKIECFNRKKATLMEEIASDVLLRTFNKFPRIITAIYNQFLIRGNFPRRCKTAKIILIAKPNKENGMDTYKYRPISQQNIGGKVLEELLINRINCHMYKNELLTDSQYGFTPQKSKTDAAMEAKTFTEREQEKRKFVIMTALDVNGAFNVAWWPSILSSLTDAECPRNLYYLSQGYFSQRTAALTTNNLSIERRVTKGCPQGSCCGPGF